jgi:hypothetical protein
VGGVEGCVVGGVGGCVVGGVVDGGVVGGERDGDGVGELEEETAGDGLGVTDA